MNDGLYCVQELLLRELAPGVCKTCLAKLLQCALIDVRHVERAAVTLLIVDSFLVAAQVFAPREEDSWVNVRPQVSFHVSGNVRWVRGCDDQSRRGDA